MLTHRENRNWKLEIRKVLAVYFLFSIFLFLALPLAAEAFQIVPCNPLAGVQCKFSDLGVLLINIYNFLLGMAGVVALYYMVFGAFVMFQGWLTAEPEGKFKEGLKTFKGAIWGLFFVATAYMLVDIVLVGILKTKDINEWLKAIF